MKNFNFRRHVKYVIGLKDVKLFVDSSKSCSQLTRFDCYHSIINENEKIYSYFVDRNNIAMRYMGGGPINGRGKNQENIFTCFTCFRIVFSILESFNSSNNKDHATVIPESKCSMFYETYNK